WPLVAPRGFLGGCRGVGVPRRGMSGQPHPLGRRRPRGRDGVHGRRSGGEPVLQGRAGDRGGLLHGRRAGPDGWAVGFGPPHAARGLWRVRTDSLIAPPLAGCDGSFYGTGFPLAHPVTTGNRSSSAGGWPPEGNGRPRGVGNDPESNLLAPPAPVR